MSEKIFGTKQKTAFSLAFLPGWLIQGVFVVWVFSFYFSAVGLSVYLIMLAYIIWSAWNAVNDPLIGYFSDRTQSEWGRRKPYIIVGLIPVLIIMIIVWLPPFTDSLLVFFYLLFILFAFDTFFTMIAVPLDCLFPELYTTEEDRAQVNIYRQIFSVIGIIGAFLIPSIFIGEISSKEGYVISGIIISIIGAITFLISIKWGITEREEFKLDNQQKFGFFQSIKYNFKNRAFVLYTIMLVGFEFIQLLQATIMPQYTKFVLNEEGTLASGLLLGLNQIIAIVSMVIWSKIGIKLGSKKGYFIALCILFLSYIPLLFINDLNSAILVIAISGIGFGGLLYYTTLLIADIIDEDELTTGIRREGSFFGPTNFFMRITGILSILTISLVFSTTGWEEYTPNPGVNVILGLRLLMAVFPMIAVFILGISIILYPLSKEKVLSIKEQMVKLHDEKRVRVAGKTN
jgi:GPH family glycoside/pentoside/hexuronide:cation symporter